MHAATQTLILVRDALRLVWRHWPTLLALVFAGYIARQLLLRLAVYASAGHRVLGMLVFALVPLSFLVALVLMLRVVRSSLPAASAAAQGSAVTGVLAHVASVLVPFVVVYSSLDYFVDDHSNFTYQIFEDEVLSNADIFTNPSLVDVQARLPYTLDLWTVGVVAVAALARYLIGMWRPGRRKTAVLLCSAYLEAVWITLAVVALNTAKSQLEQTRFAAWVQAWWAGVLELLGPLAPVGRFVGATLLAADVVILVPVAWLTVAAVLYGRSLTADTALTSVRARRRWLRLPRGLRSDVSEGFGPLGRGLALLRHAGLAPMLLFCLVFAATGAVESLLWTGQRALIGPRDLETIWVPLSSALGAVNESLQTMLLICLVAAAVERVLAVQAQPASAGGGDAGVAGQVAAAVDPHGNRPRVTGRDEESEGLVPV